MVTGMHATDGTPATQLDRVAYTVPEAAALLSVSVRKLQTMIASGEIHSIKIGKLRRVPASAIAERLEVGQ